MRFHEMASIWWAIVEADLAARTRADYLRWRLKARMMNRAAIGPA
jgi:hypothetical protein